MSGRSTSFNSSSSGDGCSSGGCTKSDNGGKGSKYNLSGLGETTEEYGSRYGGYDGSHDRYGTYDYSGLI